MTKAGEKPFEGEFWEAWQVIGGTVYIGDSGRPAKKNGPHDRFYLERWGWGTQGNQKVTAEVKFYENYAFAKPPWAIDTSLPSKDLPMTRTAPPGWNGTDSLPHTLEAKWVCCPERPKTMEVAGTPNQSPQDN